MSQDYSHEIFSSYDSEEEFNRPYTPTTVYNKTYEYHEENCTLEPELKFYDDETSAFLKHCYTHNTILKAVPATRPTNYYLYPSDASTCQADCVLVRFLNPPRQPLRRKFEPNSSDPQDSHQPKRSKKI